MKYKCFYDLYRDGDANQARIGSLPGELNEEEIAELTDRLRESDPNFTKIWNTDIRPLMEAVRRVIGNIELWPDDDAPGTLNRKSMRKCLDDESWSTLTDTYTDKLFDQFKRKGLSKKPRLNKEKGAKEFLDMLEESDFPSESLKQDTIETVRAMAAAVQTKATFPGLASIDYFNYWRKRRDGSTDGPEVFDRIDREFDTKGFVCIEPKEFQIIYCLAESVPFTFRPEVSIYDWRCAGCGETYRSLVTESCWNRECGCTDRIPVAFLNGPDTPSSREERESLEELGGRVYRAYHDTKEIDDVRLFVDGLGDHVRDIFSRYHQTVLEHATPAPGEGEKEPEPGPMPAPRTRAFAEILRKETVDGNVYNGHFRINELTGVGTITYRNGDVYNGDILHGEREGEGRLETADAIHTGTFVRGALDGDDCRITLTSGDVRYTYVGTVRQGHPVAKGIYRMDDGRVIEGIFDRDEITGFGHMSFLDRDEYTGHFLKGRFHGEGEFTSADHGTLKGIWSHGVFLEGDGGAGWQGGTYDGHWVDAAPGGSGRHTTSTLTYDGSFLNGQYHGPGRLHSDSDDLDGIWQYGIFWEGTGRAATPDGDVFEGRWENGHPREGTIIRFNKDEYTGLFSDGLYNGLGTVRWHDGGTWEGTWSTGRPVDGSGIVRTEDWTYDGPLADGLPHGTRGTITYPDGRSFTGMFEKGELKRADRVTYRDTSSYEGGFDGTDRSGRGVSVDGDERYEGEFKDDCRNGYGKLYVKDRLTYEGDWRDGMMHGYGTYHYKDGTTFVGHWEFGMRNGQGVLYGRRFLGTTRGVWSDDVLVSRKHIRNGLFEESESKKYSLQRRRAFWSENLIIPWNWCLLSIVLPGSAQFMRGTRRGGILLFLIFTILMILGSLQYDIMFKGINALYLGTAVYVFSFLDAVLFAKSGRRILKR